MLRSTPILSKEDATLSTSKYLIEMLQNTNSPVQAENWVASKRTDLKSLDEEADINIIKQQQVACVKDEVNCVTVICDDTDVFVLLTVYVFRQGFKLKVLMWAFNETVKKHAEIVPSLTDTHALSCCDSVPKFQVLERR